MLLDYLLVMGATVKGTLHGTAPKWAFCNFEVNQSLEMQYAVLVGIYTPRKKVNLESISCIEMSSLKEST